MSYVVSIAAVVVVFCYINHINPIIDILQRIGKEIVDIEGIILLIRLTFITTTKVITVIV